MDRLPQLAADLAARQVDVLVATGGANMAAMSALKHIPIVASFGADPAKLGFIASLNHPGGNVTGMTVFSAELEAKRLQLLDEIAPRGAILGYVSSKPACSSASQVRDGDKQQNRQST